MACKASGRKKSKHYWRIQILVLLLSRYLQRGVAQSGSASALGAEGRRFESCHPDQIKKGNEAVRTHFLFAIEHNGDDEECTYTCFEADALLFVFCTDVAKAGGEVRVFDADCGVYGN